MLCAIIGKNFTILDCIGYIEQSWQECSDTTINRSWSKLLPELVVNPRKGSSSYENNVQSVVDMARAMGGEGFVDIEETEVLEMVMPGNEVLSVKDVEEIVNQPSDPEQANEESENNSEKQFYSSSVIKIINLIRSAIDEAVTQDPIMTRCLNFKYNCDAALKMYEDVYKDYIRKKKQTNITQFFKK